MNAVDEARITTTACTPKAISISRIATSPGSESKA
jgi:hypothetical protein